MDRIATGAMIAAAALLMTGGLGKEAFAREPAASTPPAVQTAAPPPAVHSGRVLSLLLTLEALRLAPEVLERR